LEKIVIEKDGKEGWEEGFKENSPIIKEKI